MHARSAVHRGCTAVTSSQSSDAGEVRKQESLECAREERRGAGVGGVRSACEERCAQGIHSRDIFAEKQTRAKAPARSQPLGGKRSFDPSEWPNE